MIDIIKYLHLGLTSACNLKCKHCFVKDKTVSYLNETKILSFIDRLEEKGLTHIYYTYGEPLLYKNFFEFSNLVSNRVIYQVLMTNGTLIDSNMADKISSSKINKVMISIDSPNNKIHDANRGQIGSFYKAISSIQMLQKRGVNVGIATTVSDINCQDLYKIEKLAENLKIKYISFLALRNNGQIECQFSTEYVNIFKKSILLHKKYSFHDFRLIKILDDMIAKNEISHFEYDTYKIKNSCYINSTLSLAPNGNIYSCNLNDYVSSCNILKDTEKDIMNKIANLDFSQKRCKGCKKYEI